MRPTADALFRLRQRRTYGEILRAAAPEHSRRNRPSRALELPGNQSDSGVGTAANNQSLTAVEGQHSIRYDVRAIPRSSTAEHPTVNRTVTGSNPVAGATLPATADFYPISIYSEGRQAGQVIYRPPPKAVRCVSRT
jgi:hypothetical protein